MCLGQAEKAHTPHPELVNFFENVGKVKKIACGQRHMAALVEVDPEFEEQL